MSQESSTLNPYRPLTAEENVVDRIAVTWPSQLDRQTEIRFSGCLREEDVEELLTLTTSSDLKWSLTCLVVFGAMVVLANASWPWIMCSFGLAIFFSVMVSLLSRAYRRNDHYFYNSGWDQHQMGSVMRDRYQSVTANAQLLMDWSCFANACYNDTIVAFQWTIQPQVFRIIARHMVGSDDDWTLLQAVAKAIHCDEQSRDIVAARTQHAKAMMMDGDRKMVMEVPPDAIKFSGPITGLDAKKLVSKSARQKRKTAGDYLFLSVALVGISAIVGGLAGIITQGAGRQIQPTATLIISAFTIFSLVAFWGWLRSRRHLRGDCVHWVQLGFVTDQEIAFDFGGYGRKCPWSRLRVSYEDKEQLVFTDPNADASMSLSRTMFVTDKDWQRTRELTHQLAGQAGSEALPKKGV